MDVTVLFFAMSLVEVFYEIKKQMNLPGDWGKKDMYEEYLQLFRKKK